MLTVELSKNVPDSTYFTSSDCEPTLDGDILTVYSGKGRSRSWGAPSVTSTIVFESTDIMAIHVGFHHKHRGGQFWRYFQVNGEVKRVDWKNLDDDTRAAILEAYEKNAPNWANRPGKLRKDYQSASPKKNAFTAYKVMAIDEDGTLRSLYSPSEVYQIGKTKVEQSKPGHRGGWYVYPTPNVKERYLSGSVINKGRMVKKAALVKCECWGNREYYDEGGEWIHPEELKWIATSGKMAVTYCKPVEIVEVFEAAQ